jgi:putative nucleotidyltransferase with HDIG domain
VAFAGLATLISQSERLLFDPAPAGVAATHTIRIPLSGAYEKFSPLKGAPATYETRKIRVPAGTEIPEADRELVATYVANAGRGLGHPIGMVAFYFLLAYLLLYFMGRFAGARAALLRTQATTLGVLLAMMAAAQAVLLDTGWSEFLFPAVTPAIFAALYLDRRVAYAVVVAMAFLVASLLGFDLQVLLVLLAQGSVCVAVLRSSRLQNVLGAAGVGGLAGVVTFLISSLAIAGRVTPQFAQITGDLYGAFGGPAVAGMFALLLVAPLERMFGTVSRQRLAELAEFNHPLLKELREKAPGTWAHSIAMANLAEEAAESIGANGRLCRVAAYYHDVGKMLNPRFFTENQRGENPHDQLRPEESAEVIINHVVEGAKLAAKYKIPPVVADFIPMHHGSSLIEYFYEKALDEGATSGVEREQFVHRGEKPNTKETAIMMIVDAVEATSRSMRELTPKTVERMVEHIIFSKLAYGQLDESGLSLPELKKIALTLVDAILNQRHERVEYPWQREEGEAQAQAEGGERRDPTGTGRTTPYPKGPPSRPFIAATAVRNGLRAAANGGAGKGGLDRVERAILERPVAAPEAAPSEGTHSGRVALPAEEPAAEGSDRSAVVELGAGVVPRTPGR